MRRFGLVAALVGCLIAAFPVTSAQEAGVRPPAINPTAALPPAFQARIAEAKATMMAAPDKGLAEATAAERMAAALPNRHDRTIALATAHWLQGEALIRLNQPERADAVLADALSQVERADPGSKLQGDLLNAAGNVSSMLGRVTQALKDFQRALRILQAVNDTRGEARALSNIGAIYYDAGDYEHMLKYLSEAADVYQGDPSFVFSMHNNRGNALRELHRFAAAEAEYRKGLAAAEQLDSAWLRVRVLTNLASAQELNGQLDAAGATADQGLRIATAGWRPFLLGIKAQIADQRGDLAGAVKLVGRTFAGVDLTQTSMPFREFHDFAHRLYVRTGDDRLALAHLEAFKRLDDESRTIAANANAALLAAQFDFANQDLRIVKLKAGQLERDAQIARNRERVRGILAGAVAIAFLLLLSGYISIRRSRNQVSRANADLSSANGQLEKALKAKTEFLATTSHEIRTPLNGILGMTQVILHDPAVDATLRERVQLVQGAGETMKALVDDLLDVAKMETGHLVIDRADMDLKRVMGEVTRLWSGQAAGKGIALDVDLTDCPTRIVEDETRLRQILFNLLSNAIKFTDRGSVRLAVATQVGDDGERLTVRIADSGIGIARDQLDRIFEAFHQVDGGTTRRFGGTGLGLAICRNLSRAMGGDVTVESRPGEGSTFVLTLPLTRVSQASAMPEPGRGPQSLGECRVLLVERNPLAQSIVRAVLESEVAALTIAGDGDEALATIDAERFDEIVIEGASGIVTGLERFGGIAAIADAAQTASVTVLWAGLTEADREALLAAGATRVLAKPITAKALLESLRAARGDHAAEPPAFAAANDRQSAA